MKVKIGACCLAAVIGLTGCAAELFEVPAEQPQNLLPVDKKREAYAREVAVQRKSGRVSDRPAIYEGRYLYRAMTTEDECIFRVTEHNMDRVLLYTYEFNLCQ